MISEAICKAEREIICSILLGNDFTSVSSTLKPEDFYYTAHRVIFQAALSLADKNLIIEPVSILNEITANGQKTEELNAAFISRILSEAMGTAGASEEYAKIVKENSNKRQLYASLKESIRALEDETATTAQCLATLETKLDKIDTLETKKLVKIGEFYESFDRRLDAIQSGRGISGVSTGFKDLDGLLSGYVDSEFTIIAARPGMGKTAFAMTPLWELSQGGEPSLYISLEMSGEQIYSRLNCSIAQVDLLRFRTGKLHDSDYPKMTIAAGAMSNAGIYLADTSTTDCDESSIRALIRFAKKKLGVKLVVIDYLQLMTMRSAKGSRENEVAGISRNLKQTSLKLGLPIIALSQLSRKCEEGLDKRPTLSALRESGSLEQDADCVIGLYRDEYYNKKSDKKGVAEAIILKQRNGPTGTVELQFTDSYARFGNLEKNYENEEQGDFEEERTWQS